MTTTWPNMRTGAWCKSKPKWCVRYNSYWIWAAEEYSSKNKPSPHWFSWTNSPNSSICFDFAPLWDVQLQWHRRSHGSKKYSSAGGGSPPGLPSLPPALRNKLMIAVAVGTLGVLWSITVWAVHSRKKNPWQFLPSWKTTQGRWFTALRHCHSLWLHWITRGYIQHPWP